MLRPDFPDTEIMPDSVELLRFGRAELHVYLGMLILSCLSWHVYLYMLILLQCASSVSCQCLVSACQCLVSAERACLPSPVVCAQDDGIWMFRCISDVPTIPPWIQLYMYYVLFTALWAF